MIKKIISVFFFSFLIFSCDMFGPSNTDPSGNFWAQDFRYNNRHYRVNAELLWEGRHCNVWVEKGCGASAAHAKQVADEYDNKIHQQMIDIFSIKDINYAGHSFSNIIEVADWLGDGDGKLCILLLDIKDDYIKGVNDAYIAGYFWRADLFDMANSNKRDMIYIDTRPGLENSAELFGTLAHELQHMMNYVTTLVERSSAMDIWIDEGLSSAAEWVYSGPSASRIDWFVYNGNKSGTMKGLLDRGNNFFVWDNHRSNHYAILDDYATVYLFFQWLRLQAGSSGIYQEIISSKESNYKAVIDAVNSYLEWNTNWETLLKTWLAANYINAPSGPYGYMNDNELKNVKVSSSPGIGLTVTLAPGEGVYSVANTNPNTTGQGSNIKNAFLTNTLTDTYQAASVMLTFNSNNNIGGASESGATTGIPLPVSANIIPSGRSIMSAGYEPYRIGAWDRMETRNDR